MFSGDSKERPDQKGRQNTASSETECQIKAYLDGQPETIHMMAGWARSVAAHKAWGFETPEDVVQATLLALVQNFRDGKFTGGNLPAYVKRIAKNMCITSYRKTRTRGEHISIDKSPFPPSSRQSGESIERRALLYRILEQMEEGCRQIILLAYAYGYSRREIGRRLEISEEATRVKLFRCIRHARTMLDGSDDIGMEHM